jgi:Tfp pilus assembly protein FimT
MKSLLPIKANGYSLLEILVVSTLIASVVGLGIATYSRFERRQTIVNAGKELVLVLRDAQSRAQSGEKPASCSGLTLEAWRVILDSDNYSLQVVCGGSEQGTPEIITLPTGLSLEVSPTPITIDFATITGEPSTGTTIIVTNSWGFNYRFTIELLSTGAIQESIETS